MTLINNEGQTVTVNQTEYNQAKAAFISGVWSVIIGNNIFMAQDNY